MTVKDDWIDYNGHLNMAYYNVLFDTAVDEVFERLGIGPGLRQEPRRFVFHRRGACLLPART